jgi:hypothetical protein
MKHPFLTLILAILCAVTGYGQTIKTLGYNATNGQIVAATNVVWTNSFSFSTNTATAQVRTNLSLGLPALTNTSATNFRTAIGLGETNAVSFNSVAVNVIREGTNEIWDVFNNTFQTGVSFKESFSFIGTNASTARGETRTNLSLGLPALTNTSNVTMMRALAGSTNTNEPYSGSISVTGTNNTNTLVFTNGILREVTTP